ncbi:MAG: hypothetical protein IT244_08655 [Bacteroidia bacterium]|nr:hypothetical protein [Bacteroidia bacterium]
MKIQLMQFVHLGALILLLHSCCLKIKVISKVNPTSFLLNDKVVQFQRDSNYSYFYVKKNNLIDIKKLIADSNIRSTSVIFYNRSILLLSFGDSIHTAEMTLYRKMDSNGTCKKESTDWLSYKIEYGGLVCHGFIPEWLLDERIFIIEFKDLNWE